jgi:hypothetical protein
MSGSGQFPPKGWTIDAGYIAEVSTVLGYYQRRCNVVGRCQTQECRRTYRFEYDRLLKQGLADVSAAQIMRALRCNKLDGCAMEFREEPSLTITLGQLAGMANVGALVRCMGCGGKRMTTPAALLRQLVEHGKADAATSIKNIGKLITGPCAKCNASRWDVMFPWHDPAQNPFPHWRKELDQRIADAQRRRDLDRGLVA